MFAKIVNSVHAVWIVVNHQELPFMYQRSLDDRKLGSLLFWFIPIETPGLETFSYHM